MLHYLFTQLPGMGIGFVVAAFTPWVGRKIKGLFVKETQNVEQKIGGLGADIRKHL
jgi:hypothetical protein